jgi:hypothetical protein
LGVTITHPEPEAEPEEPLNISVPASVKRAMGLCKLDTKESFKDQTVRALRAQLAAEGY